MSRGGRHSTRNIRLTHLGKVHFLLPVYLELEEQVRVESMCARLAKMKLPVEEQEQKKAAS